ncbi:alpha carbonic anhydrase 1 [Euphorbia peplus]|nr:alpha carbonic anhydrase 1 [Euphorbia peplus]
MASQNLFFIISILLLLPLIALAISASPPMNFSYGGGKEGPGEWGRTFKTCSHGKFQSPINIITKQSVPAKSVHPIFTVYKPAFAYLVDNGFNIGVKYNSEHAEVKIDGKLYIMKLMHWHSPSEHRINGVQYPLELHIVHEAADHSRAVVAILYKFGPPDPFIASLNPKLAKMHTMVRKNGGSPQVSLGMLNTKFLGNITGHYYRYLGSLTTPPCTEPVIWTVLSKLRSVSKEQVAAIRSPLTSHFRHNCRPVQPLHGRTVKIYI